MKKLIILTFSICFLLVNSSYSHDPKNCDVLENYDFSQFDNWKMEVIKNAPQYDLDKNFVKDLSLKLFEWTNKRWIITLSKTKGELSIREKERIEKLKVIDEFKNSELYNAVLNKFEDANLIDVISKKKNK